MDYAMLVDKQVTGDISGFDIWKIRIIQKSDVRFRSNEVDLEIGIISDMADL